MRLKKELWREREKIHSESPDPGNVCSRPHAENLDCLLAEESSGKQEGEETGSSRYDEEGPHFNLAINLSIQMRPTV